MRSNEQFSEMSRFHRRLGFLCLAVWLGALCSDARASAIFDWVCDDPNCNGDPGFTAFLELSDAAVAAGDFTGVSGNILSAGVTSGVGDGFSLALGDMLTGSPGSNEDDVNNIRIVLNSARTEVIELFDISPGTNITFFRAGEGRVDFLETSGGSPYFVQLVQDLAPVQTSLFNIQGQFVLRVPEPSSLILLAMSALGVGWCQRRRKRSQAGGQSRS